MSALPATEALGAPAAPKPPDEAPWHQGLWGTLAFLAVPGLLLVPVMFLDEKLPMWMLYSIAAVAGVVVAWRCLFDPEWIMAVLILYVPYSKVYVASVFSGINGTNVVMGLLVMAAAMQYLRRRPRAPPAPIGTRLMAIYAVLSVISVINAIVLVGSFGRFWDYLSLEVKGWFDQFLIFFLMVYLVRDRGLACRLVVYMMLGTAIALASGGVEWLDKRHMASIERARLLGPQLQPNDYGAFLVYASPFFLALLLRNIFSITAWVTIPPVLALMAKVLVATFSRGAYLAMALCGVVAAWLRGKTIFAVGAIAAATVLYAAPEIVPHSIAVRMGQTGDVESEETMDASSRTRLVLWDAAIDMIIERPVLGVGFKMFHVLKERYTDYDVREGDNHNMFLFIASQFGLPCLLVFLLIFWRLFRTGLEVYKRSDHAFSGTIGLAAASMVPAVLMINMFGSRMVDIRVSIYVWITLAVVARLHAELPPPVKKAR